MGRLLIPNHHVLRIPTPLHQEDGTNSHTDVFLIFDKSFYKAFSTHRMPWLASSLLQLQDNHHMPDGSAKEHLETAIVYLADTLSVDFFVD